MKLNRLLLVTSIILLLLLTSRWWLVWLVALLPDPAEKADFIQSLDSLISIGSSLIALVVFVVGFIWVRKEATKKEEQDESPLRQLALADLRERPGVYGGRVNWIDRGITTAGTLRVHHQVIITGRMKLGKTREAVELIRQAIADDQVKEGAIFEPSPAFKFFNREKLKEQLKGVNPQEPILLFLDDFPYHYGGESIERLNDLLQGLKICKDVLIVATGRTDQLKDEHYTWLKNRSIHQIELSTLNADQVGRLIDSASGIFELQVEDTARSTFVKHNDGTPESTLIGLRRLQSQGTHQVTEALAHQVSSESLGDAWTEAKNYIQIAYPEAEHLFVALSTFHSAKVDPSTYLVIEYAVRLWQKKQPWIMLKPPSKLRKTLVTLACFDIVERDRYISAPDIVIEGQIAEGVAEKLLIEFLTTHQRLFQSRFLSRFYRQAKIHGMAWRNLAASEHDRKNFSMALIYFSKSIELQPNDATVYSDRALTYAALKNYPAEVADYTRAIALQLNYGIAYLGGSFTYPVLKNYRTTFADYARVILLRLLNDATAYFDEGLSYAALSDCPAALKHYTKAIELQPDFAEAYCNRGNTYSTLEDNPAALADYTKAIELQPDFAKAYSNRGLTYAKLKDYRAALLDHNKTIKLQPDNATAYYNRSLTYADLKDYLAALADATKAIELQPDFAQAYSNRGLTYADLKNYPAALVDYAKAIELQPSDATVYHNRGNIYADLKNYPAALADYAKAIELQPNFATAYYNRGNTYSRLEDNPTALTDYTKAIELQPDFAQAYYNRGLTYAVLKNYPAALADYNKTIMLQPGDAIFYHDRGLIYRAVKDYHAALTDYTKAIELQSDFATAYYNRGITYTVLKDYHAALADYAKAIELQPDFASSYYNTACVYAVQNQAELACKWLRKAIKMNDKYLNDSIADTDFGLIRETSKYQKLLKEFGE